MVGRVMTLVVAVAGVLAYLSAARERNRLHDALNDIATFGYEHSGHGYSCARMADRALGRKPR
jgi:hypothetical protein